jgi:hypothetical protein
VECGFEEVVQVGESVLVFGVGVDVVEMDVE